ncbi:MAG: hypothetical protein AAF799_42130 [Myxococcota bacterium]
MRNRKWGILALGGVLFGCSPAPAQRAPSSGAAQAPVAVGAPHAWPLHPSLDHASDLSGVTRVGERMILVQNRPAAPGGAQVHAFTPTTNGEWQLDGQWSLVGASDPWIDAEAITTSGREDTLLILVEGGQAIATAQVWEVSLPPSDGASTRARVLRRWSLSPDYRDAVGGSEALTRVPTPKDIEGAARGIAVLVGHQAKRHLGLFVLHDDLADPDVPIAPRREIGTDFGDTSGLYWEPGSLFVWHNENWASSPCTKKGADVNVLEHYPWSADHTPSALRGGARWKHPQPDDGACWNLEGIALGPCHEGVRVLYLANDAGIPMAAHRYELTDFCPNSEL